MAKTILYDMIKKAIKSLCPPILWELLRLARLRSTIRNQQPRWITVISGPLANCELFVNDKAAIFAAMIDGTYDAFFWKLLDESALNGGVIIDVGGHIGYHTLGFARLVGAKGRVVVFEPNRYNAERMKMNLHRNPALALRVELRQYALANARGTAQFSFSPVVDDQTSSGGHLEHSQRSFYEQSYDKFTAEEVRVERLDDVIANDDIHSLRVIKIDVEGAEGMVLEGALNILKVARPLLMIEIHSVVAMDAVYKILYPLGYRLTIVNVDRDSRCFVIGTV